jgi:hypothetical protein
LKRDHLLVFLAHRGAVVETDQHTEIVVVRPKPDEKEVRDFKRDTRRRRGRRDWCAALYQIAHKPAQRSSNPPIISGMTRNGRTAPVSARETIRFEAKKCIETPDVWGTQPPDCVSLEGGDMVSIYHGFVSMQLHFTKP